MARLSISGADVNCRYFAAPESRHTRTQFGHHLDDLGIGLPGSLSLRTMVQRSWLRPRVRVAIPARALQSWATFPSHPMQGDEACPAEDQWGLEAWVAATCLIPDRGRPVDKLWMHWLDDPDDTTASNARKHALDPAKGDGEPPSFLHPYREQSVLPWIDYFADWQAYHVAELVRLAEFTVQGVTNSFEPTVSLARQHAEHFDERARQLAQLWEERGTFLDRVACYRTIMAHCMGRESFDADVRNGARSWAMQCGTDAPAIRTGIRDVLLDLWGRWERNPPAKGPRLRRRLQQDIQYATHLLEDLIDEPIDPFDSFWYWQGRSRSEGTQLIDALPYEEWHARRDFPRKSVHYQRKSPPPFLLGEDQLTAMLGRHWPACGPLRRFVLAWVRLHQELRGIDQGLPADVRIAANEIIEQYNLIGLHTERLLRYVATALSATPAPRQNSSNRVMRDAAQRSLRLLAGTVTVPDRHIDDLLRRHTALHTMPDLVQQVCQPSHVASGRTDADELVSAHVNALILRNYAAHHDYLDDELIYPNADESKPHSGFILLSSCLLVVVAALRALPVHNQVATP